MRIFLKTLLSVVALLLIPGFAVSLWPEILKFGAFQMRHILFLSGAAVCLLAIPLLRGSHFFRTFEHELTHLVAAKCFFARMESLKVQSSGSGEVRYSRQSNFIIALAPYFLPLFASIFIILSPALHPAISMYALAPAGFLLMHHLISTFSEAFTGQPDIQQSGRLFSAVFIIFLGLIIYGCIISFAAGDHRDVLNFLKNGPVESWRIVSVYLPLIGKRLYSMVK